MAFGKKKFLSLPAQQQHKKCAELLKQIYIKGIFDEWDTYLSYRCWMSFKTHPSNTLESISSLYHWHLSEAGQQLKEHRFLPTIKKGDRTRPLSPPLPISIYLDHIRSGHNVGSIIRTTETLALGSLYFSEQTPFIDNKKVKDASMGAELWTPCFNNWHLSTLPQPVIALETSDQATCLYEFTFPSTFTLVIGNEEFGCSHEALSLSDHLIEIPTYGKKNSLNVANAYAIAGAEIRKQFPI